MISQICDSDESKSKGIKADKNVLQVFSTYDSELEIIIVDESSTEDRKS